MGGSCSWDSGTSTCAEIDQDTACNAAAADQATCEAAGTTAGDCTWTAEIAAVPAAASCALIDQDDACNAAVADQGTCEAAGAAAGDCTWTAEVAAVPATASCALTVEDLCWDPTSPSSTNVFRYYPPFILDNLGSTLTDKLAGGELLTISGGGLLHPTLRGVYSCSQDMIDAGECSELSDPYVNGIASTDFQALASEQADGIAPLRCRFSPLGTMGADIGDLFMDATLNADGNVECNTPPSAIPRDVSVEVSLNGQQYTNSPQMRDGAPLDPLSIFLSFADNFACFLSPLCGSSWFCPDSSGRNRNIQSVAPRNAPRNALSRTCARCLDCLLIDCVCRRRAFRAAVQLPRRHSAAHLVGQHPNQWPQGRRHPAADHRRKLCKHRHPDMLVPPASGNVPRRLSERASGSPRRVPRRGRLPKPSCHLAAQLRRSSAGAGVPVRLRHHWVP